jgi:PAS domain S-box-containing protein
MNQDVETSPTSSAATDQALRKSELNYRRLFETAQDGILILDAETGRVNDVNPFLVKLLGFSHNEMIGKTVGELSPFKDVVSNQAMLEQLQKNGYVRYENLPLETKAGRKTAVEFVSNVYQAGDKKVIQCNIRDITVRKEHELEIERLSQLYAALSQINQAIITQQNREDLFVKICRVLVEIGKLRMAWVGWLDATTKQVVPVAQWGDGANYLSQTAIYADDRPEGRGPTGTAVREKQNYVCNDFNHDPHTLPWRQAAVQAGFRASAGFPIRLGGVTCGAITVYAGETNFFRDREIALLEEAAADISFALDNFVREAARRQAETELRWKTAFLEAQVDSSLDGILVVNDRGKKILQNQRLNELWAIPPEVSGNKDDSAQVRFVADRTKNPREFADKVVFLNNHPDEVSRDEIELVDGMVLDRYSSPVRDKDGKHYGRIWTFRDITERKRAEESLRLLESAVEQSTESIVITDARLDLPGPKIVFVNPAFTRMTGYPAAEVIGKSPRIMQGPRTDKVVLSRLRKNLEQGESFAGEAINYRKDGTEFDLEWQIAPLRNADGKVTHFVATQHDITARKKLDEQMRQSQKMEGIGQLAGGVAHDFNNILSTIQMQAELLKYDGGLSSGQSESIGEIITSVQRAAALTRQLLLFSRREIFQPRDLDLNETIATTTKMLKRMLGETIEMQVKLAAQPLFLHADAGMLDQVLMNLCVNARDAMPNGGHLVIETAGVELDELAVAQTVQARPGSFVRLCVSDNGDGIPSDILPKIFEPFFTTKSVGKGTGLGLATVFGIVQQHQGWINVYSEVGKGTTFRIYLPRLTGNVAIQSAPALAATRGGHETILLAEDEPALRLAVRKNLAQLGYRILEAPTGVKALEVWQEHRDEISLLLTDLVMPDGMSGIVLAQRLLQQNPKLKVIYMSGYSAEVVGKDFPFAEDVNFLTKPFPAQKLAQTIRDRLDASA